MQLEQQQVRLRLSRDPEILAALRKRGNKFGGGLHKVGNKEVYSVTFNSQEIEFEVDGAARSFGENVATCLRRSSVVVLGNQSPDPKVNDDMTAAQVPVLEIVGKFDVTHELAENKCQFCHAEFDAIAELAIHVASKCPKVLELATVPEEKETKGKKDTPVNVPPKVTNENAAAGVR